jgi:glycerol-3-phosphate dehydrogenase
MGICRQKNSFRMKILNTQVLIIGGGVTGTGIARDLALRGVKCILAEYRDINAGASGGNHGLLHSGARYVAHDAAAAAECRQEGELLKRLAGNCIEDTGGLYVAVQGDDENYVADFPHMCATCNITARSLDIKDARRLEPALSGQLIAAYEVPDAAIDPFKLSLANIGHARRLGSTLLRNTRVVGFRLDGKRVAAARLLNILTGEEITVEAEQVVNAAGAWAGEVASMAGISLGMIFSKGTMLVTYNRISRRVLNRLRPPSDADIIVPGGTVSILGTTSVTIDSLDDIRPTVAETDLIVSQGAQMIPELETTRFIRAYAGVRPLPGYQDKYEGRKVSRGFALLDHEQDGVENLATITGGKLTTFRFMAEKVSDLICRRLNVTQPCLTSLEPLPSDGSSRWTEPGLAPKLWMKQSDPRDLLLCECEMVPKSAVDEIVADIVRQNGRANLKAIGLRSRIGKGPCQGTFCSVRVAAHLYEKGQLEAGEGLEQLKEFLRARFKGQHAILWNGQLIQAELMEALHCGLFGLELAIT